MTSVVRGVLVALCLWGVGPAWLVADATLDTLVDRLGSDDIFVTQRAEIELRKLGREALEPLSRRLLDASPGVTLRLQPVYEDLIDSFLEDLDKDLLLLVDEEQQVLRLSRFLETSDGKDGEDQARSRLESLEESVTNRRPRVEEAKNLLTRLSPVQLGALLRRSESAQAIVLAVYAAVFRDALERHEELGLDQEPGSPGFRDRHYLLAPAWSWATRNEPGPATRFEPMLDRHLELAFEDLVSPDYRVRERAENAFYILGPQGLGYLETRSEERPVVCGRLLELLRWRIHPKVRERTSLDFRGYPGLSFRERRRHVIGYARTAGRDAIPTLRLLVNDNDMEPSIRVKLTAAEALAGLGDQTAIRELSRRQIPELLKIPEISRDLYLLKGIQYMEEKKYDLAIQEFLRILEETPFHFEANYRLAFAYLLIKDFPKSIHYFVIARRIRPGDMLTLYNLACAYSLHGEPEKALDALEESVAAGFQDAKHIRNDSDLDPLRTLPRFRELLEKLEGR